MPMTKTDSGSLGQIFSNCSFNGSIDLESDSGDEYSPGDLLKVSTSIRSGVIADSKSPPPLLPTSPEPLDAKFWTEPAAESFLVRGPKYLKDRKKVPSTPSLFRLFAVDLIKSEKEILKGMCNHPNERVQRCLRAEKEGKPGSKMPPFIFCVNITLPGKPAHHLVVYYAVDDISLIQPTNNGGASSPFNNVASRFFFGDSDSYRDSTFKLIPRIVSGNYLVKKAVGSKPTILGKKVKQHYIMSDRFFELIVDVGSDRIAKKVVGLSRGYARTLVVDMGFLLEAKKQSALPEAMMGTVRLTNIEMNGNLRTVKDY